MNCPTCGGKTEVVRTEKFKRHVSRIRRCQTCGQVLTTVESMDAIMARTQPPVESVLDHQPWHEGGGNG